MTKTKAQLRAEAVERLRECRYHTLADYVRAMLGWGHEPHFEDSRDALIDLLTDEEPPEGDVISKKAVREIIERHFNRVAIVDDGSGKPIEWRDDLVCNVGFDFSSIADEIADMVERDYVRRIDLEVKDAEIEDLRDERDRMRADYERIYQFQVVETERNHWKSNAERYKAERDEWKAKAGEEKANADGHWRNANNIAKERDEWKAKAETRDDGAGWGMTNLDWLMENDIGAIVDAIACDKSCSECSWPKHRASFGEVQCFNGSAREWLVAAHEDEDDENCRQHADQQERAESARCESDTREKLEADALALVDNLRMYGGKYAGDAEVEIIGMLDRQAAITSAECADTRVNFAERMRFGDKIDELQSKVDRLTRENISLARDLGECMAERDSWRYRWHQVRVLMDEPLQCDRATLVDIDGEVVS